MKKLLFFIAVSCLFAGCNKTDYKAMGEEYAARLSDLCEKNDTAAVLALNDSIRAIEDELVAKCDTPNLIAFRATFSDARQQCAPFITVSKMQNGVSKEEAVQEVIDDALNGMGDVAAVSKAIDAALKLEREKNPSQPQEAKKHVKKPKK